MTYAYSESTNTTTSGAFLMFVHFDSAGGVAGSRYIKLPLSAFSVKNDFDVTIGDIGHLQVIDDNHLHLTGHMSGPNWYCSGPAIDCSGDIIWDFVLVRNYGWYGQSELEFGTHYDPLISWNTYAHDCNVTGYVTYVKQNKTWTLNPQTCKDKCRGYGDMNWGRSFPHPPKNDDDLTYAWGWYSFVLPAAPGQPELSFIMGSGKTETVSTVLLTTIISRGFHSIQWRLHLVI